MDKHIKHMDLNLLIALDALLRELHVSRAADKLSLSQSATSRLLAKLREAFNDPLLVRTSDGLIMTERAAYLQPRVKQILANTRTLLQVADFSPLESSRLFRFRATSYVAQAYFPEIIRRVDREAPNCGISIGNLTANNFTDNEESTVDLYICGNGFEVPKEYEKRVLGSDEMVCIMSKKHPLANRPITIKDYIAYKHCQMSLDNGTKESAMDTQLAALNVNRKISLRMPHAMACLEVVGNSELLHTNGSNIAQKYADKFGLTFTPLPFDFSHLDHCLYWHPVHHHNPAHIWIRDIVIDVLQRTFKHGFEV